MEAKATEGPRGRLCAFGAAGRSQPSFENVAANEKPRSLAEISPASLDSVVDSESLLSADGCDAEPRLWSELCPVRLAVPAESVRVSERARPCAVSPTPCIAPPMPCTMPSTPDCITSRALRTASPTGSLLASDSSDRALADSSDAALAFFARASAALLTIALMRRHSESFSRFIIFTSTTSALRMCSVTVGAPSEELPLGGRQQILESRIAATPFSLSVVVSSGALAAMSMKRFVQTLLRTRH